MDNLANILTVARLALLPPIILLLFIDKPWAAWSVLALYSAGAITDWLDGFIARRWNQVSDFGRFMDPISDKIFVVSMMVMLIATHRIEGVTIVAVIIILAREFMVSGMREYLGPKNIQLPVTGLAKWKTTVQMIATGLLILEPVSMTASYTGLGLLWIATILTVATGWSYVSEGWKYLSGGAD